MVKHFKGFETREEAERYTVVHGGTIYERGQEEYRMAVALGNLNSKLYPFIVLWLNF